MDPDRLDEAVTNRTKAILPVHVFGRPCGIERIESEARDRGWRLIEDSCEGLGSSIHGRPLGSFGDVVRRSRSIRTSRSRPAKAESS